MGALVPQLEGSWEAHLFKLLIVQPCVGQRLLPTDEGIPEAVIQAPVVLSIDQTLVIKVLDLRCKPGTRSRG